MKGSITVFASLMIMLISQFVFTLLEAGRNIEMAKIAEMDSESGIESILHNTVFHFGMNIGF